MGYIIDAFISGLVQTVSWPALGYMLAGIVYGLIIGLLPGLGGGLAIIISLPFIYGMAPIPVFAFLLGMYSVTATAGDITSVLFGIPGEGSCAATIIDGYAMTRNGEAGRALGAALMSSWVGAVLGALALLVAIPILRPLVLSFGFPEYCMLSIAGVSFMATLTGDQPLRALAVGCAGILLSTVGLDSGFGIPRYVFGMLYFWDGVPLVPLSLGLFAFPAVIDMAMRGGSISGVIPKDLARGVWQGCKDTFIHFWLVFRCSLIGIWIGFLPGIGGNVAQWVSYGHAVQSSKDKERFGKGDVRGVLGPGACNNSKEGGALIPTVAFGVPGNLIMAFLLAAFVLTGLVPGPDMLTKRLDVTMSFVWIIVLSNVILVPLLLLFTAQIIKITFVRSSLLIPGIMVLVIIGGYCANNEANDLIALVAFSVIGYFMVLMRWPRPPFILGFVLGPLIEHNMRMSQGIYGFSWLGRPIVIVVYLLIIVSVFYSKREEMGRYALVTKPWVALGNWLKGGAGGKKDD